jgi:hypothetical protein
MHTHLRYDRAMVAAAIGIAVVWLVIIVLGEIARKWNER